MFSVNASEVPASLFECALNMLRNDLKMYETKRTGSECSAEKLEKSTAIQVMLRDLCAVFRCTHHPPRARSTITQEYDSESADQVQSVQTMVADESSQSACELSGPGWSVRNIMCVR